MFIACLIVAMFVLLMRDYSATIIWPLCIADLHGLLFCKCRRLF
jgi:hypothetical protein